VRFLDGAGESARAEELIAKSLAGKPDYPEWLRMAAEHDASGGRFAEAAKGYVDLIDKGLAKDADYNQAGWFTLFADEPDYGSLEGRGIVQRLIAGSEAEVHTLACVMAVSGRFVEAQEAFRRYLAFDGVDPRSPAVWIAFGLYAESFGLRETAIAAYRRTEAEGSVSKGHSCHDLATLRLRRMGAE
jgi:tetratricopeptide (TPR) repeat protein